MAVFHTAEEIRKIAVEIIVDFHAARLDGAAHGYRAAATEDIDEPAVVIWSHLVNDPQQLTFAAHPRDKAVQDAPSLKGKASSDRSNPRLAAASPFSML